MVEMQRSNCSYFLNDKMLLTQIWESSDNLLILALGLYLVQHKTGVPNDSLRMILVYVTFNGAASWLTSKRYPAYM